jgi:hypothetical protein
VFCAGLGLGLLSARALADDAESVRLSIADCAGASGVQVSELVALELASRENLRLADSDSGLQASLECDDESAIIRVNDPQRSAPLVLEVDLAQTRVEARPRLLALAITELIATSRLEHAPAPAPPPPPEEDEPEPALSVWLGGSVLRAYEPAVWAGALAAGAAHSFGIVALGAELGFDSASRSTTDVVVRARAISIALTPSLALLREPFAWDLMLGVRVGYVWLDATARSTDFRAGKLSGAFIAPLAGTALRWHFLDRWFLRLAFELSYVVTPVRGLDAEQQALLELDGFRAGALVGVGVDF